MQPQAVISVLLQPGRTPGVACLCLLSLLLAALAFGLASALKRRKRELLAREKMRSFIAAAHGLKTPVSLIKSSLSSLEAEEKLSEDGKKAILTASANVEKMMEMVNGLLDLYRQDESDLALNLTMTDMADFITDMTSGLMLSARNKGIEIRKEIAPDLGSVPIDREKMSLILGNLLSNSLKYTDKGSIVISAKISGKLWELKIRDTGTGISKDFRDKVFKDTFRGSNAVERDSSGYGIGLIITSQLVRQHHGDISFESTEGKGTSFTMRFPLKYKIHGKITLEMEKEPVQGAEVREEKAAKPAGGGKNLILIAEDDSSMRDYLMSNLKDEYDVITAGDGTAALEMARQNNPDIVITDFLMPLMYGDEVCRQLKSSVETSHIPVIILTGMDDKEDIIAGLEAGASDYIVKPFDMSILKIRIHNILKERETIRQNAFETKKKRNYENYLSALDRDFMDKVHSVVEKELSNPDFQINDLCMEMGMSRTVFFNKIKSLTGQGPADYIRIFRMEKAMELLQTHHYSIAEVADAVGFSDPKYFSVSFKKQFGTSPSRI